MAESFDVIIIGGGATGLGTARDAALRGFKVLLIERFDIATGATGSNHGLLHSGARYAVTDPESAKECIRENVILRRIARHCIEDTGGLFLTLPEDDLTFQKEFVDACLRCGIEANPLSAREARHLDLSVNPLLKGAVRVPDGAIDPFMLSAANLIDAREHNAQIWTYHEVTGIIRQQNKVTGVDVFCHKTREQKKVYASVVVNAVGIWGQQIARMAGVDITMQPNKGSMLVYGKRVNKMALNRCRKPGNADILVPSDTVTLIGTTSIDIPFDEIARIKITPQEVDLLVNEGEKLSPSLARTRILRAYSGVRPLVMTGTDHNGRNISRGIALFDHAQRDGLEGYITITGGKLMTYRLMAEWTVDLICSKLGVKAHCTTATEPLPGSREEHINVNKKIFSFPSLLRRSLIHRHGDRAIQIFNFISVLWGQRRKRTAERFSARSVLCPCEEITSGEVIYAQKELGISNLMDLRRRTRVGMGECQGEICICRAAGLLGCNKDEVTHFLQERWKGITPVAWGDALRESEITEMMYGGICGFKNS
ncbi:MAG: anaerobic glycerol-3-phosphate dehydrogenase subunit A [Bacteroidales bacterium]|jgi:glycerol-3-phosphate dehydrogenase|nr:anaerobic glycerol-3-phosphate dehydrogenase subunit A [Bacteroidales bacterium]